MCSSDPKREFDFSRKDKSVKPPISKTQQDMHMKTVFDKLELGMEMNTSSNSHIDKSQIRTKKDEMPNMQRFELSIKMRSSYSLESPS